MINVAPGNALTARGGVSSQFERVVVSGSASFSSGVAGRYATALFEIAKERDSLPKLESDIASVEEALAESPDFRHMIQSPMFSRGDMANAVGAIARRMDLGPELANTLGLMARNRRLFVLSGMLSSVRALIADDRGEVTADVTSARPLSDGQIAELREQLKAGIGSNVDLNLTVDESLIGGLVVKVGSRMIDSSVRSKLANLQNVMKEVG